MSRRVFSGSPRRPWRFKFSTQRAQRDAEGWSGLITADDTGDDDAPGRAVPATAKHLAP